jgi:putative drug exporter of the RND superfamily
MHPRRVLGMWVLAAFAAVAALMFTMGDLTSKGHVTGNPESRQAAKLAAATFPADRRDLVSDIVVVRSERYRMDDAQFRAFVQRALNGGRRAGGGGTQLVSRDRHALALPVFARDSDAIGPVVDIVQRADAAPDFAVSITGDNTVDRDFDNLSGRDLKNGELRVGAPAALIVLLLVFGAVVAGLIPLLMAMISIVVGLGLVALLSNVFGLSTFIVNMLSGMGLALGIDYSLFVISRYREERGGGRAPLDAIAASGATASRAVLLSGSTFVVAMFGLLIIHGNVMRSLALGAILVGTVSVAAALTLLPALLGLLQDRVNALRLPFVGSARPNAAGAEGRFWRAVIDRVLLRPALSLGVAAALLIAAATPLFDLHVGTHSVTQMPNSFAAKRGYLALQRDFPKLTTDPVRIVVAGVASPQARSAVDRVRSVLASNPNFGSATVRRSGDVVMLAAPVRGDPDSSQAIAEVRALRGHVVRPAFAGTGAKPYMFGTSWEDAEYFDAVTGPAPYVFAFVLGLTFVLLTLAFRSVVVAGTAIVLNLLSVGAAYGLLVLVFEKGFATGLLGFQHVDSIEAWVPLFLFAVLFGLSMDYQVFLLSRIKERYDTVRDTTQAVVFGVSTTARIITGAALIIVAAFAGFASGELVMFQQMGFGVGIALLIDATVIRSVILPSAMRLLGRRNWYLPSWLEWLPRLEVEAQPMQRPAHARRHEPSAVLNGGGGIRTLERRNRR